jgi:hypothetical protein
LLPPSFFMAITAMDDRFLGLAIGDHAFAGSVFQFLKTSSEFFFRWTC